MITREQQATAEEALLRAIKDGTPRLRTIAFDPETGAMCSCAVIGKAFGWEPTEEELEDESRYFPSLYEMLDDLGFDTGLIYGHNDRGVGSNEFEGGLIAVRNHEVKR